MACLCNGYTGLYMALRAWECKSCIPKFKYIHEYTFPPRRCVPAFLTFVPLEFLKQIQHSLNVLSSSVCNYRMTLFWKAEKPPVTLEDGIT